MSFNFHFISYQKQATVSKHLAVFQHKDCEDFQFRELDRKLLGTLKQWTTVKS